MTRLTEKDVDGLGTELIIYERNLAEKTGLKLGEIAAMAGAISWEDFQGAARDYQVGVVPITSGQGVIGGFSEAVVQIIRQLGFKGRITEKTDVNGFYEGVTKGLEIIFMADDARFVALNLRTGQIADNAIATGRGYVAALNAMTQGFPGSEVLVLGCGPVGLACVEYLLELGSGLAVYDCDSSKLKRLHQGAIKHERNLEEAIKKYPYIVDATPASSFISLPEPPAKVFVAAPGVPMGLTNKSYSQHAKNVIHDPLQIGVATMLAMAVSPPRIKK